MSQDSFRLKGSRFSLTVLQLQTTDTDKLSQELGVRIQQAPQFFYSTPLVLNFEGIPEADGNDIDTLLDCLRALRLMPIAFEQASNSQKTNLSNLGLAQLSPSQNPKELEFNTEANAATPATATDTGYGGKVVRQMVRSGQQIHASGDLVILGSVGHGAEVLAEGNIHVYGSLRGRALAGINGNNQCRIFCDQLEAELVSIAGHFMLRDDLPTDMIKKRVSIGLTEQERLCFDLISPLP